jgi:hypothetical protein
MRLLSDMEPDELALLADEDFRESVQTEARSLSSEAFDTYVDVMHSSDDDGARVKAADKILSLAGIEEKQQQLPSSVSEEVFRIALAGLGKLAGIAQGAGVQQVFRDVTPAKADPRSAELMRLDIQPDDSPMSRRPLDESDNDAVIDVIAGERYEIFDRK